MVEKVDKPQAPPAYHILPTKETKEDQSRKQEYEEGEEHYQKGGSSEGWNKFRGRAMTIKPVRAPRDRIDRVLFRNTVLRSGMGILETTVVWKDGRTTEPALFLIPRPEDYMKLRILKRGQVVPENYWAKGDQVEMGIVQMESASGSWGAEDFRKEEKQQGVPSKRSWLETIGLMNAGKFQWFMLFVYLVGATILVLAVIFATKQK